MRYKWLMENKLVFDAENNATIPVGNGTSAAIEFAAWLADGNTPDAADVITEQVNYVPCKLIVERLKVLGKDETVWSAMTVSQQLNFLTLEQGIAVNDADVIALLTACGIDSEQILY